jgi:hypothetical protein
MKAVDPCWRVKMDPILTKGSQKTIELLAEVMAKAIEIRSPAVAAVGLQSFGGQVAAHPPSVCYLERDTSTTLRIKVAKANSAPRKMHNSAKVMLSPLRV